MLRGRRVDRGLAAVGLLAALVVVAGCGSEDAATVDPAPGTAPVATSTSGPPEGVGASTSTVPATTTSMSSGDPAPTTVATAPTTTTVLAGGPIPEAPEWFCAELAVESAELVMEVEAVLPADGTIDPRSQHALLLATRNLLAWTNNRVPVELRPDVGLLNRVYADLGIELDRLDPETVTMPRLQALVFAYVLDSPVVDAAELDLSARRLAAYVDRSCGHGYPIMEAMADLFATPSGGG